MGRIIDISHPIYEGMLTPPVPWIPPVEVAVLGRLHLEGRSTGKLTISTHAGTHVDAQLHFVKGGKTIDQACLETLVGEAVVVDMTHKGELADITAEDFEKCGVEIKEGDRIILHTGWWKRWDTNDFYPKAPGLTVDAAEWLVKKKIKLLAMDIPGPDGAKTKVTLGETLPIHHILLTNNVTLVEYLTNLDQIRKQRVTLIALPLKIKGADGAPARVIVIED